MGGDPERPIVSWGELLWDLFPDGARLGGCAANVAYHLACLGEPAALVSRVGGDDLGRRAIAELSKSSIDVANVQIDDERPTGTVRVELTAEGEPTFSIVEQAAWDNIDCNARVAEVVGRSRALVFGTLAQRTPLGSTALRQAVDAAPGDCIRVCDLNVRLPFASAPAIDASLSMADAVKLNEAEAGRLSEAFGVSDVLSWLLDERGMEVVALTRGARGCMLATRSDRVEHVGDPAPPGGDAVGAGDAFTAVLVAGLARADHVRDIGPRANLYASAVASRRGAMPPMHDVV